MFDKFGEPADVVQLIADDTAPNPGPDEISIRVTRRLLHPGNLALLRGEYPVPMPPGGMPIGVDGVGTIAAVGQGVDPSTGRVPGARVAFFPGMSSWSDHATVPAACVFPIPDDIPDDLVSVALANTVAVLMLLRAIEETTAGRAGVAKPILLTAAGSSVARVLITIARRRGLPLIGTVRSRNGVDALSTRFPGLPVVTTEDADWKDQVREAAGGEPVDVIVDPVGGKLATDLFGLLSDGGTVIFYGGLDSEPVTVPSLHIAFRGLTLRGVSSARWLLETTPEQSFADVAEVMELVRAAPETYPIAGEFVLTELAAAVAAVEEPGLVGGVILRSNPQPSE